jgi:ribosome maturation factor RimP
VGASGARFAEGGTIGQVSTSGSTHARERALQADVADSLKGCAPDVEVIALELAGPDRFCLYIDHTGGVDHALCERVTNVLRPYLQEYAIEVSSPGTTRPLRTRAHFDAAAGKLVAVRTAHAIDGRKRFKGRALRAGDDALVLKVDTGAEIEIPYAEIVRGNLIDEGR